jgi:hypothetical protein
VEPAPARRILDDGQQAFAVTLATRHSSAHRDDRVAEFEAREDVAMTAQVPDTVLLDGERLVIAGVSGHGLFRPEDHHLRPAMIHTACWRGYVCQYVVANGRLVLGELHLGSGSEIDGQGIGPGTRLLGGSAARQGIADGGGYVYRSLGWPVPFTGGLLLGADFVRSTYVHMGFHPAWKFGRVIELVVEHGVVQAGHDRSAAVAERRRAIEAGELADPDGSPGGMAWIERTFTLDYSRTYGSG